MLAYVALIWVYFYGVGNPPQLSVQSAASAAECRAVIADAKKRLLARDEVRDVQGGCLVAMAGPPHDKV
jgi:hypothetical protein